MIAVLAVTATLRPAAAAVDQREMKAREAFAMGQYQEALDLFAKLYAEKLHPNYLRNIGRCYQNLGEPDKAINSFREYLRKAKTVSSDERQEVEGYIKEMEDLKAKQQATTTTPPNPTGTTTTGTATTPATTGTTDTTTTSPTSGTTVPALNPTTGTATTTTTAAGADLTGGPQPAAGGDDGGPIYGRWWFWAIVAGVAAAGLGVAAAAGAFTTTQEAKCPEGTRC